MNNTKEERKSQQKPNLISQYQKVLNQRIFLRFIL